LPDRSHANAWHMRTRSVLHSISNACYTSDRELQFPSPDRIRADRQALLIRSNQRGEDRSALDSGWLGFTNARRYS
jgi:hypothetical protein